MSPAPLPRNLEVGRGVPAEPAADVRKRRWLRLSRRLRPTFPTQIIGPKHSFCTERRLALCLAVAAIIAVAMGCASKSTASSPAPAAMPPGRTGHWVTLPAETGTHIPRRVWVEDGGSGTNLNSGVTDYSKSQFERMQRQSVTTLPPAGAGR